MHEASFYWLYILSANVQPIRERQPSYEDKEGMVMSHSFDNC